MEAQPSQRPTRHIAHSFPLQWTARSRSCDHRSVLRRQIEKGTKFASPSLRSSRISGCTADLREYTRILKMQSGIAPHKGIETQSRTNVPQSLLCCDSELTRTPCK